MLFQLPTSALLLALAVLTEASSSHGNAAHHIAMRRRHLNPRGSQDAPPVPRAALSRRSCRAKQSGSSLAAPSTTATTHSTTKVASKTTTKAAPADPTSGSSPSSGGGSSSSSSDDSSSGGSVAAGSFKAVKPANWPSATQSGDKPASTVASASDPYLENLSKALDNSANSYFTQTHTGEMTYYGQGLGACGDVYDDQSFTAAVSMLMFDDWPGASAEQNRNPICGPFVPGRRALNQQGLMVSAVKSSLAGYAMIGGDGLINCVGSTDPIVQCHIPLTATVTHGDKSIQVKIVDRCVGCKVGDIDLTPAAFAALADMALGRTDVTWKFDDW